ncbi:MAG: ABC transporter ATP-binding protein [Candidatus Zixiibacteriota bacterium]
MAEDTVQHTTQASGAGALRLTRVQKAYGEFQALVNISFDLVPGELMVALGPSGCGKTTLLRIIAGLEAPTDGEIWLGDRRIDTLPPNERDLSLVFQNYALYPHMTVSQNLAFPLKARRIAKSERREKVAQIANLLDLDDQLKKKPGQLSGGQRQRVALGRAIIRRPNLYLLDEPLSNLDAELRSRMRREIVSLQKSLNISAIYVTHDQTEALTMGDRILVLQKGMMRQFGTPAEIYHRPADTFVAGFVGAPKINFLDCRFVRDHMGREMVQPLDVPFDTLTSAPGGMGMRDGVRFILGIRPEDIYPGPIGEHKGVISEVEFHGDRRVATMKYKESELTFFTDSKNLRPGSKVTFNLRKGNLHFFDSENKRRILD